MADCPNCGARLETPLGCQACGTPLALGREPTPFEVFGFEPAYALDAAELQRRLLRFSRIVHPDYFAAGDAATRALAERNTARLNQAHALLAEPASRADWLVRHRGGPSEAEQRDMPRSFLMDVLEWNETLDAARQAAPGSAERAALDQLESTLREKRRTVLADVERLLTPLPQRGSPELAAARAELNALRYLDKTLSEVAALRLEHATSR